MRLTGRIVLAVLVFPLGFVAIEPYPPVLRAAAAALALVLAIVALFLPEPVEVDQGVPYTPAPVDPTVLMHHADQLCPVPASSRPPVDDLLAGIPGGLARRGLQPDEVIDPPGNDLDARLERIEDAVRKVAEDVVTLGSTVEDVAQLSAKGIARLRQQIEALEAAP